MIIGCAELRLRIPGICSLKEKRTIVKSLKDRVRNRFNVSIAEVADHDRLDSALLAATTVSCDSARAHSILEAVVRFVEGHGGAVLADYRIQML